MKYKDNYRPSGWTLLASQADGLQTLARTSEFQNSRVKLHVCQMSHRFLWHR